jgi:ABC-type glutathione transport system ATPase component
MRKVQGAVADAKALMGRMETILCRSDIAGDEASTLNRLKREAARLAEFAIPESRTVGLVGDSGVGK